MKGKNKEIIFTLISLIVSMIMLSFASVPIYSLFCKVTGFGGTVQQKMTGTNRRGKKQITVNFDANVEQNLQWQFIPKQRSITVTTGENNLVFYYSRNLTNHDIVGTAVYNVTPNKAGQYFVKVFCFCFEEQLLKQQEEILMPVSFYIDPAIEDDPYMNDINTITLSYTFFKIRNQ
ncbi:cytochrome c oxidase assembly CtaG/Cox11 family protein [Orientia chuto str. Dubai]|uniref:Cytochrome c oxidase assembly protein CtaG n=2 Tax=Candidatus Orientia mediorientalis TaxID=911112 RepID=A0A0F3MJN5_9RICK|nr:cytochrome c oxidase assembly CtaG/Cox11 family protein [Orientia chuto str. Dubai]